jgi:hypothetical protein
LHVSVVHVAEQLAPGVPLRRLVSVSVALQ